MGERFDLVSSSEAETRPAPSSMWLEIDARVRAVTPGPAAPIGDPRLSLGRPDSGRINVALCVWKSTRFQSGVKQTDLNDPEVKFSHVLCLISAVFCWRADAGFCVDVSSFRCWFWHLVVKGHNWLFSHCKLTVHTHFKLQTCWIYLLFPFSLNPLDLDEFSLWLLVYSILNLVHNNVLQTLFLKLCLV